MRFDNFGLGVVVQNEQVGTGCSLYPPGIMIIPTHIQIEPAKQVILVLLGHVPVTKRGAVSELELNELAPPQHFARPQKSVIVVLLDVRLQEIDLINALLFEIGIQSSLWYLTSELLRRVLDGAIDCRTDSLSLK